MKYLIVGLGNIGPEYHETRHNIGFMAVDALAKAAGATFTTDVMVSPQHCQSRDANCYC